MKGVGELGGEGGKEESMMRRVDMGNENKKYEERFYPYSSIKIIIN